MNITKKLTLQELIRATELCGESEPGSCPECPLFDPSGDFECIEYLMLQVSAALKEYSCNGGSEVETMPDKEIELKNCPCCGGRAKLLGQRTFYVECQKCFLATDRYARPQFAAEAWNRRTEGQLNE